MRDIERRVLKLEDSLSSSRGPETLSEVLAAFERGDYGQTSVMAIVASIMSNGGSVDHLKDGELPDMLIDFFAECLNKPRDNSDDAAGYLLDKRESDSL